MQDESNVVPTSDEGNDEPEWLRDLAAGSADAIAAALDEDDPAPPLRMVAATRGAGLPYRRRPPAKPLWMRWAEGFSGGRGHYKGRPRFFEYGLHDGDDYYRRVRLGFHAGVDYQWDDEHAMWLAADDLFRDHFLRHLDLRREQDARLGPDPWCPLPEAAELTPAFLDAVLGHARHLCALGAADVALAPELETATFGAAPPPPQRWLARLGGAPLLPAGAQGVVYGRRASHKSFFAVELAAAIATGRRDLRGLALDYPEGAWAVYVAAEDAPGLERRLDAACRQHGATSANYVILKGRPVLTDPQAALDLVRRVRLALPPRADVALIVVDTYNLSRGPGEEENSADAAGRYTASALLFGRAFPDCAVLTVHHANAQGGMRGSTALGDNADFILRFEREGAAPRTTVTCEKQKNAAEPAPFDLTFADSDRGLVLADVEAAAPRERKAAKDKLTDHAQKALAVRALALAEPASLTWTEWLSGAGVSRGTLSEAKALMEDRGFVSIVEGRYRLTATGLALAASKGWGPQFV